MRNTKETSTQRIFRVIQYQLLDKLQTKQMNVAFTKKKHIIQYIFNSLI